MKHIIIKNITDYVLMDSRGDEKAEEYPADYPVP